jgi:hypothetical protein
MDRKLLGTQETICLYKQYYDAKKKMSQSPSDQAGFRKMSPFVIEKTLQGLIGTATNTKRLRSGDLLVEVGRKAQSDKLLSVT